MQLKPGEEKLERFWVSQGAVIIRDGKVLILRDAVKSVWMLPGGRSDCGEIGEESFARELKEELDIDKFEVLETVGYEIRYTRHRKIPYCAIANLVDIGSAKIKISPEHSEYKWIKLEEARNFEYRWEKTVQFLGKAFELYKKLHTK